MERYTLLCDHVCSNSSSANLRKKTKLVVTTKNSLPSESSENTVLEEIQYGESYGGDHFSIGRSMTKLCIKINQNCGATRARKLLSTNADLDEMDPKL